MNERDEIVCRCEEVTKAEIEAAIAAGDRTLSAIKKRTRAGMGCCQGKTCQKYIAGMIREASGGEVTMAEALEKSERIPAGTLTVGLIAGTRDDGDR